MLDSSLMCPRKALAFVLLAVGCGTHAKVDGRVQPAEPQVDAAQLRSDGPTRARCGPLPPPSGRVIEVRPSQARRLGEIVRRARHAPSSVKRYVETFGRVVVLWEKGLRNPGEIAYVVGISERLAREYLVLRERYARPEYRDRLEEIARQVRRALSGEGEEKRGSR